MNDAVNLYLGLFDSHNTYFNDYKSGATPHYSFLFDEEKVSCYNSDSLLFPGVNYYFGQKSSHGYIIEAKISFVDTALVFAGSKSTLLPFLNKINIGKFA